MQYMYFAKNIKYVHNDAQYMYHNMSCKMGCVASAHIMCIQIMYHALQKWLQYMY